MLDVSPTDAKLGDTSQALTEATTQAESETTQMEEILKVFQDLGLEDSDTRERFRRLAKPSDWHTWRELRDPSQDTRNNTRT